MERMKKPKFIKEIEKSEGKERAKCGRWYIGVYGELDHKPMVELESLEIIVKELHKLEEENKKLKDENDTLLREKATLREYCDELDSECDDLVVTKELLEGQLRELTKENKKLKEKLSEITMVADDEKQN